MEAENVGIDFIKYFLLSKKERNHKDKDKDKYKEKKEKFSLT
jgi:arginyl-tRNA synthetase